jgi:hypothetical protein
LGLGLMSRGRFPLKPEKIRQSASLRSMLAEDEPNVGNQDQPERRSPTGAAPQKETESHPQPRNPAR